MNQTDKTLIMMAFSTEQRDSEGNLVIPASLFTIYECEGQDALGEWYMASSNQQYAHRNKDLKGRLTFRLDDFKGAKGISREHYSVDELKVFIDILMEDGYTVQRAAKHGESELADELFIYMCESYRKMERESGRPLLNF